MSVIKHGGNHGPITRERAGRDYVIGTPARPTSDYDEYPPAGSPEALAHDAALARNAGHAGSSPGQTWKPRL